MGLLYGRAGRLTAQNGDFRPGQELRLVEAQVQAGTEFSAAQLGGYLASQSANVSSLAVSLPAAAREAVALEFRRAGEDSRGRWSHSSQRWPHISLGTR